MYLMCEAKGVNVLYRRRAYGAYKVYEVYRA